jgi:hypothetical protein
MKLVRAVSISSVLLSLFCIGLLRQTDTVTVTAGRASGASAEDTATNVSDLLRPLDFESDVDYESVIDEHSDLVQITNQKFTNDRNLENLYAMVVYHNAVEAHERAVEAARSYAQRQDGYQAAKDAPVISSGGGGGNLPPILRRIGPCESTGVVTNPINYTAESKKTSASGGFQFIDSTWDGLDGVKGDGYMGYMRAMYAPPYIQDQAAIKLNKESGTSPWVSSKYCWG